MKKRHDMFAALRNRRRLIELARINITSAARDIRDARRQIAGYAQRMTLNDELRTALDALDRAIETLQPEAVPELGFGDELEANVPPTPQWTVEEILTREG